MINLPRSQKKSTARRIFTAVLLLVLISGASAPAAQAERWLFIFNTSSAMKSRQAAVETEIKSLFATGVGDNLHAGDSVGVWTFDQQLRTGQFPLTTWVPENAAQTTSSLIAFLRKQYYHGDTSFAALQPLLGQVIAGSERLTVVIVCDGGDEIHWTPYDDGINEILNQTRGERKKSRQPYVILIRTQLGKYIGATVNFPPAVLNVPSFPPLPEETKAVPTNPPPKLVAPVPTKPQVVEPPLIIVGSKVGTNLAQVLNESPATNHAVAALPPKISTPPVEVEHTNLIPKPLPPAMESNVPPVKTNMPVIEIQQTNLISNPPVSVKTNVIVAIPAVPVTNVTVTNAPVQTSETTMTTPVSTGAADNDTRILIYVGVGLFAAAAVLVIFFLVRGQRAPRGSLISRSMQDDSRPPDRK